MPALKSTPKSISSQRQDLAAVADYSDNDFAANNVKNKLIQNYPFPKIPNSIITAIAINMFNVPLNHGAMNTVCG